MAVTKKGNTTYKRDKNKIEISGEPKDVRGLMWFDLLCKHLLWIVPVVILLFIAPKASVIPPLIKWLGKYLPVALTTLLFLSG